MNIMHQHGLVAPAVDVDSRWWWDGIEQQRLLLPQCGSCDRHFFPPQPTCPYCGSDDWRPFESSAQGSVYSWVVVHVALNAVFADDVPYTIVAVELDEGVRIIGRLKASEALSAGDRVEACFYSVDGTTLLGFQPRS
jgi:uncharacterized OB-fold protein